MVQDLIRDSAFDDVLSKDGAETPLALSSTDSLAMVSSNMWSCIVKSLRSYCLV